VDDIVQSLFQDRSGGLCIDVGLIPQPEGDAVPDKQKLAIVVGDRSWIRYPPVRTPVEECFLAYTVPLGRRFQPRCCTARIVRLGMVGAWTSCTSSCEPPICWLTHWDDRW